MKWYKAKHRKLEQKQKAQKTKVRKREMAELQTMDLAS